MVIRNDQEDLDCQRNLPEYGDDFRATITLPGQLLAWLMALRTSWTYAVKAIVVMFTPFCLLAMSSFTAARGKSVNDTNVIRFLNLITTSIPRPWGGLSTATTATAFVIALMTYTSSVYSYHRVTEGDKHQRVFVLTAFATGLTVAWTLGFSPVVGIFSLGASGTFLGLLVSDIFHSIALRHRQQNRRSVGERPGIAVCDEKVPFLGDEASPEFVTVTRPLRTAEPCEC